MIMLSWITKIKLELMAYEAMFATQFCSKHTQDKSANDQRIPIFKCRHQDPCPVYNERARRHTQMSKGRLVISTCINYL
jgi:hypothetical protein